MDETTGANTTPTATESTTTADSTTSTATTGAETTGAKGVTPKTYSEAEVQRMIKDRIKNTKRESETNNKVIEALKRRGVIQTDNLEDVLKWAETATDDGDPDPVKMARFEAEKSARAVALDVRIDFAAEQLAKDPLFSDLSDPDFVDELRPMARLLGGDVKKAYMAAHGDKYAEKLAAITEARIVANQTKKASAKVESGDSGGGDTKLGLTAEQVAFARKEGMDLEEYAALVHGKDIESYERFHAKKNKK